MTSAQRAMLVWIRVGVVCAGALLVTNLLVDEAPTSNPEEDAMETGPSDTGTTEQSTDVDSQSLGQAELGPDDPTLGDILEISVSKSTETAGQPFEFHLCDAGAYRLLAPDHEVVPLADVQASTSWAVNLEFFMESQGNLVSMSDLLAFDLLKFGTAMCPIQPTTSDSQDGLVTMIPDGQPLYIGAEGCADDLAELTPPDRDATDQTGISQDPAFVVEFRGDPTEITRDQLPFKVTINEMGCVTS